MLEYFPTAWKSAKFIPIPQSGKPPSDRSHRPFSFLSTLSKLIERVITSILNFLCIITTFCSRNNWASEEKKTVSKLAKISDFVIHGSNRRQTHTGMVQILGNSQLYVLLHVFVYFMSVHVSSVTALIIRRSNFINTSSGMINLCE